MKTPFTLLATAAALLIATGAAHADVLPSNASISYEASVGPLGLDWDPAKRLSLSQFDPLLGTLNAVSFKWGGQFDTHGVLTNFASGQNTISYTVSGNMRFDLPLSPAAWLQFGPKTGDIVLAVDEVKDDLQILVEALGGGTYQGILANFIGEDSFEVHVLADGISVLSDEASNFGEDVTTEATAWVQVTYDYTKAANAVPEPGALSLLGLALAAAGIASRRRA